MHNLYIIIIIIEKYFCKIYEKLNLTFIYIYIKFNLFCLDVITINKTGEYFRLIYDVKGRFTTHRITAEEAKVFK